MTDNRMRAACLFMLSIADVEQLRRIFLPLVRKLDAFAAAMASSPPIAGRRLRMPDYLTSYLPSHFDPEATLYGRLDFVLSGGLPILIEVNFGTPAGGSIDAEAYGDTLSPSDGLAFRPNSARMSWLARQCRYSGYEEAALPIWPWRHFSDPASYFSTTTQTFSEHGVRLEIIELDDLLQLPRPVRKPNLRLFSAIDAYRYGYSASDLGMGVAPAINWLHNDSSLIASSKQLLANRQFLATLPTASRSALAETYLLVPKHTHYHGSGLDEYEEISKSEAIVGRDHLVLKPCHDQGGNGVVIGRSLTDTDWATAVFRSQVDGSQVVLQAFHEPDSVQYRARNVITGETAQLAGAGSYGAYFLGNELIGLLARVSPYERGALQPVNGHTGALLTAIAIDTGHELS